MNCIVMTTVHGPNAVMEALLAQLGETWRVIVAGDEQTPEVWHEWPVEFLSLERQREEFGAFAAEAPTRHYARKNFGYLHALALGATRVLEIDDDNLPGPQIASTLGGSAVRGRLVGGGGWANVYRWFGGGPAWPRGLPLDAIHARGELLAADVTRPCPVRQYLVNGDPDVDAIYRLVFGVHPLEFEAAAPVLLAPGTWCPFNSQNTLWSAEAFPLLYLPHHATFRMTDIWRSLVAQRALWTRGGSVAFLPPNASQARNPHDLLRDFADETPGYLHNRAVSACLDAAASRVEGAPLIEVGRALWLELVRAGFLPEAERPLVERWFAAVTATGGAASASTTP